MTFNPIGVGDFSVGFSIDRAGQGWYFHHGGVNWGFVSGLRAHKIKGYGLVVMTNSGNVGPFIGEIVDRIEYAYGWDALDDPAPR